MTRKTRSQRRSMYPSKRPRQAAKLRRTRDGSIVHPDGRILFFSISRFINDVCAGNRCFVCGADPAKVPFNDEHVLPDWLLRMFRLHQRRITLPNLSQYRYGQYKVPCCQCCNTIMGELIEKPVSQIVSGGMEAVRRHLVSEGPALLYTWLALIFVKTHLRDRAFREHLDVRKGDAKIGDRYDWEGLHHVHCVARSFHSQATWSPGVLGSLEAIEARVHPEQEAFDYADLYAARTMLVRMNDICLIAVLNDAGAALQYIRNNDFTKIDAPPVGIQLRELMARFALINHKLEERPLFKTSVHETGAVFLVADLPDNRPRIGKFRKKEFGLMLYGATLPNVDTLRDARGRLLGERVKKGLITFLYDRDGRFIKDPFVPIQKAKPTA